MRKIYFLTLFLISHWSYAQTIFQETFSTTTTPTGWTNTAVTGGPWVFSTAAGYDVSAATDHTGDGGNYAWLDFSGTDDSVILTTPVIDASSLTTPYLEFYYESHYLGGLATFNSLHVEAWNGSAWVNVNTFQGNTPLGWDYYGLDVSAYLYNGTDLQFRFHAESSGLGTDFYNDLLLDDVVVKEMPTCQAPTGLAVANITATSADITWIAGNATPSGWEVSVVSVGMPAMAGTSGASPYTALGLTSASLYDVYVREVCAPGDSSTWLGPVSFTTPCLTITAPYNQDFESLALTTPYTDLPICWTAQTGPDFWDVTNDLVNTGHTYLPNIGDHTSGTGNYMWIDASGDITGNAMISPTIDLSGLTVPYVGFWFASNNSNNAINHTISLDAWDGSAWVNLTSTSGNFPGWVQVASVVPGSIPSQTQFRIQAIANASSTPSDYYFNDLGVDDFFVIEGPACIDPFNLTTNNLTDSTVDLAWSQSGTTISWDVEFGTTGFSQGSGSITNTSTNPLSVTALTANTSYDFYVRAVCGVGDSSSWVGPLSFNTPCASYTPNYLEEFSTYLPSCWEEAADGLPATGATGLGVSEWGATNYLNGGGIQNATKINMYNVGTNDWLLSPTFDLSAGGWELVINAGVTTYNGSGSITMGSDDSVQVLISTNGGTSWSPILVWDASNSPSNTGNAYVIDLSAYTGTNTSFAIWASEGLVDDLEDFDFHINDFEIRTPPSCVAPSALAATSILTTSADLSWTQSGTTIGWDVEYGLAGFVQSTGTATATSSNPLNITGLTANTSYDFYVRAICGPGDSSTWVGPTSFATPCLPVSGDSLSDAIFINTFPYADSGSTASCYTNTGYNLSADVFYQLIVPSCADTLVASLCGSSYDTYIRILDVGGNQIGFNDDFCAAQSEVSLTGLTAGDTLYVVVEGYSSNNGDYILDVDFVINCPTTDVAIGQLTVDTVFCNTAIVGSFIISNLSNVDALNQPYSILVSGIPVLSDTIPNLAALSSDTITLGPLPAPTGIINVTVFADPLAIDSDVLNNVSVPVVIQVSNTTAIASVVQSVDCNGDSTGQIRVLAQDGLTASSYMYMWDSNTGNATSDVVTALTAGVYSVTVSDDIGCSAVDSIILTESAAFTLAVDSLQNVTCNGGNDGLIEITIGGATPPYAYSWSNGATTDDLTGLIAGTYTGTVSDSLGCSVVAPVVISEPTALVASITDNGDGTATAVSSGGTGTISFAWSNGDSTATASGLSNNTSYVVSLTDANGCTDTASVVIVVVDVKTIENWGTMNIFPNPANRFVTVQMDLLETTDVSISLYTAIGQLVHSNQLGAVQSVTERINTQYLASGIYMVQVQLPNQIVRRKIIVRRDRKSVV